MGNQNKKFTPEQVQERVRAVHGDNVYIVENTYVNMLTKALFVDKDYGEWWALPNNIINNKTGHRERSNKLLHELHRMPLEEVKRRLQLVHGDAVTIVDETYVNSSSYCLFVDAEYGQWLSKPFDVIYKRHNHPKRALQLRRATWMSKYGVDSPFKVDAIQRKAFRGCKQTTIVRHWKTDAELLCRGSYEKAFVEWANVNRIDFEWQIPFKMPDERTYWIDAKITSGQYEGLWIEIKGFFRNDAREKWEWFHRKHSCNSQLWDEKKLKEVGILTTR